MATQEWSDTQTLFPKVDQAREFLEIANDFANPLDIIREAISNAYDAKAKTICIRFDMIEVYGEPVLRIKIEDDGEGMNFTGLQAFFDLGNSTRRSRRTEDPSLIGEKGHGTKIFFNSDQVDVKTSDGQTVSEARLDKPFISLHDGHVPEVQVKSKPSEDGRTWTHIQILGYNRNQREKFSHAQLKDHVHWFTKHGSIENQFREPAYPQPILYLRGLDVSEDEEILFGHPFPQESIPVDKLFDQHKAIAPDYFCKKWIKRGTLPGYPDIAFGMVFVVEGDKVKRDSNPMLTRRGALRIPGSYQVQERYGLWITKDYIPIQRKNEWVTSKGSEFTKFHAFVNCQSLRLTANRGSVENTSPNVIEALEEIARSLFEEITSTEDWELMEWLEGEAIGEKTREKEVREYYRRIKDAKAQKYATHKGTKLIAPRYENGVYSLLVVLQTLEPDLFPFEIIDYDTHSGIDVIAKTRDNVDVSQSMLRYVEFKHTLTSKFNHSFTYLHSIVCWNTAIQHDEEVEDVLKIKRKMVITPQSSSDQHTRYMLDDPQETHKIEVFVLETYLKEKLGIVF